jgi:ubiquitin conjugation factor E4 B
MAAKITHVAYKSLDSHIEFTQDALIKIKDIIISKMEYSQLPKERQELIKKLLNKENIELEYPTEFIDPILCSVINYPVKIPNVSEFFDRTSILTHIYEYKKNPYTREELTVEIFTEYNSRPEIIEEIHKFMERKKKFEDENR